MAADLKNMLARICDANCLNASGLKEPEIAHSTWISWRLLEENA